jgi:hypothetical protein
MPDPAGFDRSLVLVELAAARERFVTVAGELGDANRDRASVGTRWTNHQLLFHMLLGYLVVWPLLVVIEVFDRLPPVAGRQFAGLLNRSLRAFDAVNFWGGCLGATVLSPARIGRLGEWVIAGWERRVQSAGDGTLNRVMCFPTRWDPFFTEAMSIGDLLRYPTQHFRFHERQLDLTPR